MSSQLFQWQLFLAGHCHHWLGQWTRYNPQGNFIEQYDSERIFALNADKNSAHQKNLHHKPSGLIVNEWELTRGDGQSLGHPHCATMACYCLPDFTLFWVPFKSAQTFFGIEIILTIGHSRASVFATYNDEFELSRFTIVREYQKATEPVWSFEKQLGQVDNFPGEILAETLTAQLGVPIETQATKINWPTGEERAIIHFPDQIAFNVPKIFNAKTLPEILVQWRTPDNRVERRVVKYEPNSETPRFLAQTIAV